MKTIVTIPPFRRRIERLDRKDTFLRRPGHVSPRYERSDRPILFQPSHRLGERTHAVDLRRLYRPFRRLCDAVGGTCECRHHLCTVFQTDESHSGHRHVGSLLSLLRYDDCLRGSLAWESLAGLEHSHSAWDPPIYPVKLMIPLGAMLLLIQGMAKLIRDITAAVTGKEIDVIAGETTEGNVI